jgi:hypothetical protein
MINQKILDELPGPGGEGRIRNEEFRMKSPQTVFFIMRWARNRWY